MRHLFVSKNISSLDKMVRSRLDDYAVLILVKYAFVTPDVAIDQLPKTESQLVGIAHKVKGILSWLTDTAGKGQSEDVKTSYPCVGKVIALGKEVRSVRIGDDVVCAAQLHQTDLVRIPEHLVIKVEKKELKKEALLVPFGAHALHLLRRSRIQLGEWVCVVGLDVIGMLCVQLARKIGCRVIAIDHREQQLTLAKKFGCVVAINSTHDSVTKEINLITEHQGVDVTIVARENEAFTLANCMAITRKKGRVIFSGPITCSTSAPTKKELSLMSVCTYGMSCSAGDEEQLVYARWTAKKNMQNFMDLLNNQEITFDHFMSPDISCADFSKNQQGTQPPFGYILKFEAKKGRSLSKKDEIQKVDCFIPAVKDTIHVGFLGVRCLESSSVMHEIKQTKNLSLDAVVNGDIASGKFLCANVSSDEQVLYHGKQIDLVVVGSSHKMHWQQAQQALKQKKAVLVANPLVTDQAQLQEFKALVNEGVDLPLMVDYHRSYAPFMQKIKEVVRQRKTPLMVQYRMNNPLLNKEQLHQLYGAGRIIGQAAHIIDLFCFLTDAQPRSVSVESLHTTRNDIFPTDNFSAQIAFDDGSICSLFFTTIGHSLVGVERMEAYFDQKAIVMDDWQGLYGFGLPSWFNETVSKQDRGEHAFLAAMQKQLKQSSTQSLIPLKRLECIAELTLLVDQLACDPQSPGAHVF